MILGYIMLNNKLLDINRNAKKLVTRLLNPEISNINAFTFSNKFSKKLVDYMFY